MLAQAVDIWSHALHTWFEQFVHFLISSVKLFIRIQHEAIISFFSTLLKVGATGLAVGIEHIDDLVNLSISNINNDPVASGYKQQGRLEIVLGDGRQGYAPKAPYDVIHVGAAAPSIPQAVRGL